MGFQKGTRWKLAFRSQDGELVDRVWAHMTAHGIRFVQDRIRRLGLYKNAPKEFWLMVPLEDYPVALACVEDFKRSTPESDSTEFGGWTCGQPKMT